MPAAAYVAAVMPAAAYVAVVVPAVVVPAAPYVAAVMPAEAYVAVVIHLCPGTVQRNMSGAGLRAPNLELSRPDRSEAGGRRRHQFHACEPT